MGPFLGYKYAASQYFPALRILPQRTINPSFPQTHKALMPSLVLFLLPLPFQDQFGFYTFLSLKAE